jgi:hypothetical protein
VVPEKKYSKPSSIADLAARLAGFGYWPVPIPAGSKGPTIAGWDALRITPQSAPEYFHDAALVGCLHVNLGCFDIDVTDEDLAAEIVAEGFKRFPRALERIGKPPKSAIVFRLDDPGYKVRNTEKHSWTSEDGEVFEAQVEVRTLTRQMVVYGAHPETKKPYTWPRGELWETPRDALPEVAEGDAQAFRDWCNDRIRAWAGVEKPTARVYDLGEFRPSTADDRPSEAEFLEALSYVPATLSHNAGWLEGLMAIHDFYGGAMRGLEVAKTWSSTDSRFNPHEVEMKWRSFEAGKGISYRAVFHHAQRNGANLSDIARKYRGKLQTDDLSADFKPGEAHQFREMSDEEKDAIPPALFRPWVAKDLAAIPRFDFLYADFYARGYTSVTIAPPKVGKSMLGLAEAIDMATGRGFLTGTQRQPLRVVYYNAEDDQNVIDSRVAALLTHYDIPQEELEGWLFPTSGVDMPEFYMVSGQDGVINEALFVSIEKFIEEAKADVLIFDPLQDLSRSPETNEVFRLLGQRLRRMCSTRGVALGLIHHTRKVAPGMQASIDDARGGSALRGTARFNRLLNPMTEDDAAKAGVANHRFFFRVGDVESNLAPPSADVNRWFEKVSVLTPNGHHIGAVVPWKWPDAFDGLTRNDASRVRSEVARMAEPPRADIRSKQWIGTTVAAILGFDLDDPSDKSKVKSIVQKWIETDVLKVEEVHNARNGRAEKVVVAGDNNPLSEEEA